MSKGKLNFKTVCTSLFAIIVLVYIAYQAILINYEDIKTETALYAQSSDVIETAVFITREETLLETATGDVLNYLVEDGQKVAKGEVIADMYPSEESAQIQSQIVKIDAQIEGLESLKTSEEYFISGLGLIDTQINDEIANIFNSINNNDFLLAKEGGDNLQFAINQKKIILGEEQIEDYTDEIEELKLEKERLENSGQSKIGTIYSTHSGYFALYTDGYENAISTEDIENVSVSDIANVQKIGTEGTNGKILEDFSWYALAIIDQNEYAKLQQRTYVEIEGSFAVKERLPVEIVAANRDETSGDYALVLRCTYMDSEIALIRNENINIIVEEHSGVLVRESAIYFEDVIEEVTDENGNVQEVVHEDIKGVFIKYGERIEFVQVFSDITVNGYAVCKLNLSEEERAMLVTDSSIQVYDEVVIDGDNLYDGKTV